MLQKAINSSQSLFVLQNRRLPLFVFLISFFITLFAAGAVLSNSIREAHAQFERQTELVMSRIQNSLVGLEHTLNAGRGLFSASKSVERNEWKAFVDSLDLNSQMQGILGLGYAARVLLTEKSEHEAAIHAEGFPKYKVWPVSKNKTLFPIIYLEPFTDRNQRAFGFDMYSDKVRREAMDRAWKTGRAVLSGKVFLVQEKDQHIHHGFLFYEPIYSNGMPHDTAEEREKALVGFVYSPIRTNEFMRSVLGAENLSIDFEIFSGTKTQKDALLYDYDANESGDEAPLARELFRETRVISFAGQVWTLRFHTTHEFYNLIEKKLPIIVLVSGVLGSALLSLVAWYQVTLRDRAAQLAEVMTSELNQKIQELETAHVEIKSIHDQVVQAEKMAAVGTLLAGVTHELNNKIAPILGYVELLQLTEKNESKLRQLKTVEEAALQARGIVEDLLSFSRAERKDGTLFDLKNALQNTLRLLAGELKRQRCEIIADIPEEFFGVTGSEKQLGQVFLNLIKNGMDAMERGNVKKIEVQMLRDGQDVVVKFRDYGCGIVPENLKNIFDPFYTTKRDKKGTGLGLSVSDGIVKSHGGKIEIKSWVGEGTEVSVRLPLTGGNLPAPKVQDVSVEPVSKELAQRKILVVEDTDSVREVMRDSLGSCGFECVTVASSAEEALEKMKEEKEKFDLIISDLRMPGMGGIKFYDHVVAQDPGMKSRFLILTGDTFEPGTQAFIMSRKVNVLYKPFHLGSAFKIIRNILK